MDALTIRLSDYCESLEFSARARYKEKTEICGFDPYSLKKSDFSEDFASLPQIEYPDIVNYLVLQTSWATKDQMKSYKRLKAYNFLISGWVSTLLTKLVGNDKILVYGRVNHSQSARETPLKPWILAEKDGSVIAAHCNCMAGLSEDCSHIGALLFASEAAVKMLKSLTCTQQENKWLMPRYVKEVPYLPIYQVDFSSAKKRYSNLCEPPDHSRQTPKKSKAIPPPSPDDIASFFKGIAASEGKPAVLSVIPGYNEKYVPKQSNLPQPLTSLFQQRHMELGYLQLLDACDKISLVISGNECKAIESQTRLQSQCRGWFSQQAGRITASKLTAVCNSSCAKPSKSLVKTICYPEAHKFTTVATRWGCTHESRARDNYQQEMCPTHENFIIGNSGLQIDPGWPHLGASPDGVIHCGCCGKGVCEIRCPFCQKGALLEDAVNKKNSCLITDEGKISLDHGHSYYYQVQAQIFICNVDYCDFVVWTEKDIHIERVLPDIEFWERVVEQATKVFQNAILPELVGKWFTRPTISTALEANQLLDNEGGPWCYCQQELEAGTLIGCDNDKCEISWFHLNCLKLDGAPKGKWYCPTCWRTQTN